LKQTIKQLQDDHDRQRQAARDADADLLSTLSAAFQARAMNNDQIRDQSMQKLSSNLRDKSAMRYALAEERVARTEGMMRSNVENGELFERVRNQMDSVVATKGLVRFLRSSLSFIRCIDTLETQRNSRRLFTR
jgi:hypothetical protein